MRSDSNRSQARNARRSRRKAPRKRHITGFVQLGPGAIRAGHILSGHKDSEMEFRTAALLCNSARTRSLISVRERLSGETTSVRSGEYSSGTWRSENSMWKSFDFDLHGGWFELATLSTL
jgi:hypothetical protein